MRVWKTNDMFHVQQQSQCHFVTSSQYVSGNLSMLLFGVENFHVFKIHRRPPTINRKITMVVPLPYCHSKPNICMYLVLRVHLHRFHPLASLAERVLQSVSCG